MLDTRKINKKVHIFGIIVYLVYLIICHVIWEFEWGSDPWFQLGVQPGSLMEFITSRYFTWTSRVLPDYFIYIFGHLNQNIWRVLDISAMLTLAEGLGYVAIKRTKEHYFPAVYMLLMLIPPMIYGEHGYGPTTIGNIWPVSAIMFSFILMKKQNSNLRIRPIEYILAGILAIFGVGDMPVAAITLTISLVVFFNRLHIKRREKRVFDPKNIYVVYLGVISLAAFIFAILCPGNANRILFEAMPHPEYLVMSLGTRISTGYLYAGGIFFLCCGDIYILYALIALFILLGIKKKSFLLIALQIPALFTLGMRLYITFGNSSYVSYLMIDEFCTATVLMRGMYLLWFTILWVLIFLSVTIIVKDRIERFYVNGLVLAGIVGAMILGLRPSILNGEFHAAICAVYCMIVAIVRIWNSYRDDNRILKEYLRYMKSKTEKSYSEISEL